MATERANARYPVRGSAERDPATIRGPSRRGHPDQRRGKSESTASSPAVIDPLGARDFVRPQRWDNLPV